jgi:glycosyltransferase involved in cell wall biosynthesis
MSTASKTPLITIGITCFNAEKTIERAIKSALAQSWENKEILVVDDCSSDTSISIVEEMEKQFSTVRLIKHEKNKGPGGARQTLLENARGEFIAFFDDDDDSLPERIETQAKRIISYENETGAKNIACYAGGYRLYDNGYKKELPAIGSGEVVPHGTGMADYILFYRKHKDWFYGSGIPTCSLMARKAVLLEAGGFDETFRRVEDMDLAVRLALKGTHFIGCPEELFVQHATNAPDKSPDRNLEAERKLADKHKGYLETKGMYEYARRWPEIRYYHFKKDYPGMFKVLAFLFIRYPIKTATHFLDTAPRRFLHERKMTRKAAS